MDVNTVACDICGQQKQETNHWIVAVSSLENQCEGVAFLPAEAVPTPRPHDMQYEDLCGEACAHKRLSRWLDVLKTKSSTTK
jgi:hypothetical protein